MAKITIHTSTINNLKTKVVDIIHRDISPMVVTYLRKLLQRKTDARGKSFPIKKDSTKKQYLKKGWNTENWLVRKDISAQIVVNNTSTGIRVVPADPNNILKYVNQADDWFLLNSEIKNKIIDKLEEKL